MIKPTVPANEPSRLKSLRELNILDSDSEREYDNITQLAQYVSGAPVSMISLIDANRQWFKSKVGIELCESSRDDSFCGHAILTPGKPMIVPDATKDVRFQGNSFTNAETPVVFYAGFPILDSEGYALGTLCVIDSKPKNLEEEQINQLKILAKQVEKLLELRKRNIELRETKEHLAKHNNLLKSFAGLVSHDMKMPLSNLILTTDILRKEYSGQFDEKGREYLDYLKKTSFSLSNYISNILDHYEATAFEKHDYKAFELNAMLEDIVDMLDIRYDCELHLPEGNPVVTCNQVALKQIFINLIGNSLKYNDKDTIVIELGFSEEEDTYHFFVKDNGIGIEKDELEVIFELFKTSGKPDREGNMGHGIGLSTVKKLVVALGGKISIDSIHGEGATFSFSIEKP